MKYLVGGLEPWNFMTLPSYWEWNVIIPTDFHSMIFQRGGWLNHQPVLALPMVKQKHWNSSWKLYPDVFLKGSTISWDFTNEWNPHDGEIPMFKKLEMVMKSSSQPVKNYWRLSRFCIFLTQKVHPTKIPCDFFLSWIVTTNWRVQCVISCSMLKFALSQHQNSTWECQAWFRSACGSPDQPHTLCGRTAARTGGARGWITGQVEVFNLFLVTGASKPANIQSLE